MRGRALLLAAVLALAACKAPPAAVPKASRAPGPLSTPAGATVLSGVVRAIAENGAGLISDHGSGLIGNNGAAAIAENGAGVVSNHGAGLRYALHARPPEGPIANALVEVLRPDGAAVRDDRGQPVTGRSDAKGAYRITTPLPPGALLLRTTFTNGGSLLAIAPPAAAGRERRAELDTASTLGARYVIERLAAAAPQRLDEVPAGLVDALRAAIGAALGKLEDRPLTYDAADMAGRAARLRLVVAPVDDVFRQIEAILLAGRAGLGDGLLATAQPLAGPRGVAVGPDGTLWVLEGTGRLRRVGRDGVSRLVNQVPLIDAMDLVLAPDGRAIVSARGKNRVVAFEAAGTMTTLAGTGRRLFGPVGGLATETDLFAPSGLGFDLDGRLLIAEYSGMVSKPGRILRLVGGRLEAIAMPPPPPNTSATTASAGPSVVALADGTLHFLDPRFDRLWSRAADGTWRDQEDPLFASDNSRLARGPDGALYMASASRHQVVRLGDGRAREVIAGTGTPGYAGDDGPAKAAALHRPCGLAWGPDGTLYVAELGNGTVRAIDPAGTIRTVAGTPAAGLVGDALVIPLNVPAAVDHDAAGRLVISELGGNVVKRLSDGRLETIAGGGGSLADGVPAREAAFDRPGDVAPLGDDLLVADLDGYRIRRIRADGTITTEVGTGTYRGGGATPGARAVAMGVDTVGALASNGKDAWCWTEPASNVVLTVRDGLVYLVAGKTDESTGAADDGATAAGAPLAFPYGAAYGADGSIYVSELLNMRIVRIAPDGKLNRVAGRSLAETLDAANGGGLGRAGQAARDTAIFAPGALAVGLDGSLFVAELGTGYYELFQDALGSNEQFASLFTALPPSPARLWRLPPNGPATIVAGPGGKVLAASSGPDALGMPLSVAVERNGDLVVVDALQGVVRRIPAEAYGAP